MEEHMPSLIENAMAGSVRKVGDKVVFLEQMAPRRRDGVFEVGSDQQTLEAHLEV